MSPRKTVLPALAAGLLLAACTDRAAEPTAPPPAAASASAQAGGPRIVPDRYIVVFHKEVRGAAALADRLAAAHGGKVHYRYEHAIKGFAATLSPQAVEALRRNPNVAHIEPEVEMELAASQVRPPWGLNRIDQLNLPMDTLYNYYTTGAGVTAYVIDTGINIFHPDFGGRAVVGFDALGGDGLDCNGHGTHVAGIIGSNTYGVAKAVKLVSVRVTDCDGRTTYPGTTSGSVVAGLNWVAANHDPLSVANISIAMLDPYRRYPATDDAVRNLIASGVTVVTGAAHSFVNPDPGVPGENACNYSPARVAEALTVAASTPTDSRVVNGLIPYSTVTWSSNYGPCVDLFAPGDSIRSTSHTGSGSILMSGTSQASPHVAGYAARYLGDHTTATPAAIASYIVSWSTDGKITNAGPDTAATTTRLLYTGTGPKRRACCS